MKTVFMWSGRSNGYHVGWKMLEVILWAGRRQRLSYRLGDISGYHVAWKMLEVIMWAGRC